MGTVGRQTVARSCLGAGLGALVSAMLTWGLWAVTLDAWHSLVRPAAPSPEDALMVMAAAVASLLAAWLGVGTTASFLAALPGTIGQTSRRVSDRIAPRVVRRLVAVALGGALVATTPGLAVAAPADSGGSAVLAGRHTLVATVAPDLDPHFFAVDSPGPLDPHFVAVGKPSVVTATPAAVDTRTGSYVVRRGDSLWHIAARELPSGATSAQIATRWQQWYAANRATIGPDPDQLEIGQRLEVPSAVTR